MHQTRQFTKRRPQSPLLNQQQTVDGLQINKPALPRSGLAIQSNAPIHSTATSITRSFTPTTTTVEHAQHIHPEPNQYHYHDTSASAVPVKANVPHGDQKHFNEPHHGHDHHGHDHHGHDHHGHDHHGHDLHTHDHHNHNHHEHGHAHNHSHHSHNHNHNHNHNPNHDHDHHHGHDHAHHQHSNFPQVYTQPLPSYASIFASLIPFQKALFTCFMGHFFIGIILWWLGVSRESLSITGFSYLVLFDSFGTLNNFVSSVLHVNPAFTTMSTKRPFGVKRFEVVLALANTIFLLFGTMYTTKESLEHLLLEEHHGGSGDHHGNSGFPLGLLVMLLVAIAASFASSIKLKNHDNLVNLTKRSSQFQHEYIQNTPLDALVKNIYSLSIVSAGSIVFVFQLFGLSSPSVDKFLAFAEASLMLYLGAPTATALAKVLLQTMPDAMTHAIDHQLRSIQQIPSVVSVDKVHFWQNAYGKCIGTLEVHTRPDADEDAVINASFDILEPLVKENEGELTISIIKMK